MKEFKKHKRNLVSFMMIAIMFVFVSCNNEECDVFKVDETSQKVTDLVGTLKMDDNGKWNFVPDSRFSFPFMHGICDGYSVQIVNWDSKYEDYKEGCLVQGKYKKTEYKSFGDGLGGISYYDLEISQIDKYDLPDEDNTRSSDGEVLPCMIANEDENPMTRASTSYVPIMDTFNSFRIRLFVHVVRSTSGVGLDKTTVKNKVLNVLTEYYDGTGLSFECIGEEYIDSDAMNKMACTQTNINILCNKNPQSNAVDVYILSDGSEFGKEAAGAVLDIGKTSIVSIKKYYDNVSTLAHEMGHVFNLYHTHRGSKNRNEGGIAELVNGSNSQVAGDYVTDTPADPCVWSGSYGTDANGDSYKPDVTNLMCYNPNKDAREHITPGQLSRMNNCLMTNAESIKVRTVLSPYSVTGGKWINTSEKYSVNFPDTFNVTWDVLCKRYTTTSSTNYTSMLKNYSGKSIEITNFDTSFKSQNYNIKAYGESSKGFKFLAQRTAYYLEVNPNTSTLRYSIQCKGGSTSASGNITISNSQDKTLTISQGGTIQFYFSDACGIGNGDVDMSLWMNGFSKVPATKNVFQCSTSAPLGSQNSPLNVMLGSKTKMLPLKVTIVQ